MMAFRFSFQPVLFLFLAVPLLVAGSGCAGYHMGNQFLYRNDIRSVHVAIFETDSYRRFQIGRAHV